MKRLSIVTIACALTACGGGGGGDPLGTPAPASTAQGLRTGTANNGSNLSVLVLENNEFWSFYSTPLSGLIGFVQGTHTGSGNTLGGSGEDFIVAMNQKTAATVSATYVPQGTASGSLTEGSSTVTFNLTTYDTRYDQPASLTDLAGTWSLISVYMIAPGSITSTITIAANGTFTGSNPYCSISGSATPRSSGKNVFNLSASFTGGSCAFNGQTLNGVAVLLKSGASRQLTVAALRADRMQAFLASGSL